MSQWNTRAHDLRTVQAQQLAHVITTLEPEQAKTYRTTAAGDTRKLRGIPAIARGVAGAIPGTNPSAVR